MINTFKEFANKKTRESVQQLNILKKLLEKNNFKVNNFSKEEDPYIFLHSPVSNLSFGGVRIYKIGETIAYRVQKEKDTHPYGKAYRLDVEGMYNDLISENGNEEKSGKIVIHSIVDDMKTFFERSLKAEKELQTSYLDAESGGKMVVGMGNTDYSSMVMNSKP